MDGYGYEVSFNSGGNKTFKTVFGVFMTLGMVCGIIAYFGVLCTYVFNRSDYIITPVEFKRNFYFDTTQITV